MKPEDIKAAALAATIDRENRKVVIGGVSFDPTEARQLAEGLKALASEAEAIPHHRPGDVFVSSGSGDFYISDGVSMYRLQYGARSALPVPAGEVIWRRLVPVHVDGTNISVGEALRAAILTGVFE